jgi:hypothetical protein
MIRPHIITKIMVKVFVTILLIILNLVETAKFYQNISEGAGASSKTRYLPAIISLLVVLISISKDYLILNDII